MKCKTCGQEKKTKFPDGIDWHILGIDCKCGQDILPVADNAGEDINLYEKMEEYRGKKCEGCNSYFKLIVEEGNMASK